jgi:hypothetical protein
MFFSLVVDLFQNRFNRLKLIAYRYSLLVHALHMSPSHHPIFPSLVSFLTPSTYIAAAEWR